MKIEGKRKFVDHYQGHAYTVYMHNNWVKVADSSNVETPWFVLDTHQKELEFWQKVIGLLNDEHRKLDPPSDEGDDDNYDDDYDDDYDDGYDDYDHNYDDNNDDSQNDEDC